MQHTFTVYLERADDDLPKQLLGTIDADTAGNALHKASQYWEYPSYDLTVEQTTPNTLWKPQQQRETH